MSRAVHFLRNSFFVITLDYSLTGEDSRHLKKQGTNHMKKTGRTRKNPETPPGLASLL